MSNGYYLAKTMATKYLYARTIDVPLSFTTMTSIKTFTRTQKNKWHLLSLKYSLRQIVCFNNSPLTDGHRQWGQQNCWRNGHENNWKTYQFDMGISVILQMVDHSADARSEPGDFWFDINEAFTEVETPQSCQGRRCGRTRFQVDGTVFQQITRWFQRIV